MNRIHLELNATDRDLETDLERLLTIGATTVNVGQSDVSSHVLADPNGNEFCLLRRPIEPESSSRSPGG
jgi:hypothetical protein